MRQGDIITVSTHEIPPEYADISSFLVITHCCTLARQDEPVELLPCHKKTSCDGNMTKGKNPRILHFVASGNWYEVRAREKIQVVVEKSNTTIVEKANSSFREMLQNWLALGYRRHTLHDEINSLLKKLAIQKLAQKHLTTLLGIWIDDFDENLLEEEPKHLELYFIFDSTVDYISEADFIKEKISTLARKDSIAKKWSIKPHCLGDDDFIYYEARRYIYVNYDYLSIDAEHK